MSRSRFRKGPISWTNRRSSLVAAEAHPHAESFISLMSFVSLPLRIFCPHPHYNINQFVQLCATHSTDLYSAHLQFICKN